MGSSSPKGYVNGPDVRKVEFKKKDPKHKEAVIAAIAALEVARGSSRSS